MSFNNLADPILIVWHTDGMGNKITIPRNNEDYVVVNGRILLDYIPDKALKVTFSTPISMVEVPLRNILTTANQYKVDYTNGMVYLYSSLEATTITVSYYSRGIISYPASRVYTEATGLTVTETLQQRIDYLLTVGGDYDSAESGRVSAENIRVSSENTRLSNEDTRINSENIRISQEDTRESNETTRITTFDTFVNNKDIDWGNFKTDKNNEWIEFTHKGDYSSSISYKKFNIVKSGTTTYMAIQNTTVGISPNNSAYWRIIAINGDNFTPRGIYNGATAYSQYDIVTYQNGIYMAKGSTTGNLPTNITYWDVYLKLDALEILYQDVIADSIVTTTYSGTELTSVIWENTSNATIRTDTYTYSSDVNTETITELRTLAGGGETLEIVSVFDLDGNFISGASVSNGFFSLGGSYSEVIFYDSPRVTGKYAKNVWDLQVFDGKIYVGQGNSSNIGLEQNAGEIPVYSLSPETGLYTNEFVVDDEQIDVFKVLNGDLYIPGHDPTESWALGNFYRKSIGSSWVKKRTIPQGVHTYDMEYLDGKLFVALGAGYSQSIYDSSDMGETWTERNGYNIGRFYTCFEFEGSIYFVGSIRPDGISPHILNRVAKSTNGVMSNITSKQLIPIEYQLPNIYYKIKAGSTFKFLNQLIYIVGLEFNDHQIIHKALCKTSNILDTSLKVYFPELNYIPTDLVVRGNVLYTVGHVQNGTLYTNIIYRSTDLNIWEEVVRYKTSSIFVMSFEELNGEFYLGMGTYESQDASKIPHNNGQIIRITNVI